MDKAQNSAYVLLQIRDAGCLTFKQLLDKVYPFGPPEPPSLSVPIALNYTVNALHEGGLIYLAHDGLRVTPVVESLRSVLGISLTELATLVPRSSLRVQPLFGVPSEMNREHAALFVMMPFEPLLRPVYEDHMKVVADRLGLTAARADDFFTTLAVIDDIWAAILSCRVVVADCTGRNPNVFYEVGIAHTVGKPVVLITQDENDVPFDLRHRRYLQYQFTPRGMAEFEDRLARILADVLQETNTDESEHPPEQRTQ